MIYSGVFDIIMCFKNEEVVVDYRVVGRWTDSFVIVPKNMVALLLLLS